MHIIDRRLNPGGKSLSNRQRFIRRARAAIRNAVKDASKNRAIREIDKSGEVAIPAGDVSEPSFRREASGGVRNYVLPGNKEYIEGDVIDRPRGGGSGANASQDGEGEDEFRFVLTREEFLDLFLEDLELPDLVKQRLIGEGAIQWRRAGYRTYGSPTAISVPRTLRHSLARRIALRRPSQRELAVLREDVEALEREGAAGPALEAAREKLARLTRRATIVPYIDPIDVRYRRLESYPKPLAQAVVFCLMDVSGSMDEHRKDLAKRFYTLLYLFLTRRYERVEVVFIRHTHQAAEVDEDTFFHSRETGGTVVSTALEQMITIQQARYPASDWNIYAAQCSDGDNTLSDNPKTVALLTKSVLPIAQFYAYIEVASDSPGMNMAGGDATNLWRAYQSIQGPDVAMAMRQVSHRRDIYPVFRDLFAPREGARQ
jgi:uncharacterized protein